MSQAMEIHKDSTQAVAPASPATNPVMDMIKQAVAAGQPLEVIRELKIMAREIEAEEAERSFNSAFADFKGEVVEVQRNRLVTDGPLKGRRYAELFSFVDAATPALSRHGLSASWSTTRDERDWIEVTCTIKHKLGGSKSVSFGGPPDAGGAKNPLQARISTVTYLERVTFKMACGLAEQGDDDDGQSAGSGVEKITEQQVLDLNDLIDTAVEELGSERPAFVAAMLKFLKTDKIEHIPAKDYQRAVTSINYSRQQK